MKLKILSILLIAGIVSLTSCEGDLKTDEQLIAAIQDAPKQEVAIADLPVAAAEILNSVFSERTNEKTLMANGLGYEIQLNDSGRSDDGDDGDRGDDGEASRSYVYFDVDGRQLGERTDNGSDRSDDGDRGDDDDRSGSVGGSGSSSDRGDDGE